MIGIPRPVPAIFPSVVFRSLAKASKRDGKLETACDAVISLPTVSRIHAKIRKKEENYFLSDMNSRNGTSVNGRLLRPDEEYQLEPEDEVDFAQARYIFLE